MSDGPTSIQVAPTEDEAMKLATLFRSLADSVVKASSLPAEVESLRKQVETLTNDRDAARTHSQELDNQLREMREARDAANSRFNEAASTNHRLNDDIQAKDSTITSLRATVDTLNAYLAQSKKDRDEEAMHAMELEDKLKTSDAKLEEIQGHMAKMFGLAKPEPVKPIVPEVQKPTEPIDLPKFLPPMEVQQEPAPANPTPPTPTIYPAPSEATVTTSEPTPVAEPSYSPPVLEAPAPSPTVPSEADPFVDFSKPYEFDGLTGKYRNT